MDRNATCPLCEEYEGEPRQVEAHISGGQDEVHAGEYGGEYRTEILESRNGAADGDDEAASEVDLAGLEADDEAGAEADDEDASVEGRAAVAEAALESADTEPAADMGEEAGADELETTTDPEADGETGGEADDGEGGELEEAGAIPAVLLLVVFAYLVATGQVEMPSLEETLAMFGVVQGSSGGGGGGDAVFQP